MTSYADERRLLQWIDERGGPAATVNVAGRDFFETTGP